MIVLCVREAIEGADVCRCTWCACGSDFRVEPFRGLSDRWLVIDFFFQGKFRNLSCNMQSFSCGLWVTFISDVERFKRLERFRFGVGVAQTPNPYLLGGKV